MRLVNQVEALLFYKNEPVKLGWLVKRLATNEEALNEALNELEGELENRGFVLMRKDNEVRLGTNPEMSGMIEDLVKEEISRDLGRAGLETLSIVLYNGPISRTDIDYLRGVNSQFILRNLLVRGLVERVPSETDKRSLLYRPTFDLLSHLGITDIKELPDYDKVVDDINKLKETKSSEEETD